MGFVQAAGDPCLYMASEGEMFLIAVYVDDILLAGRSNEKLTAVKKALKEISSERHGRISLLPGSEGRSRSQDRKCLDWTGVIHREHLEKIWYGGCQDNSNSVRY